MRLNKRSVCVLIRFVWVGYQISKVQRTVQTATQRNKSSFLERVVSRRVVLSVCLSPSCQSRRCGPSCSNQVLCGFSCVCVGGEGGRRRRRRRSLLLLLLILSHHEHPYGIHTNIGTGKPAKRVVAVSVSPWCLPLIVGQMSTPLGEANTRSRIVCARVLCRMLPTTITASPCSYSLDGLFVNHCLVHTPKHTYIHTHTHTCTHITIRVDGRSPCPP